MKNLYEDLLEGQQNQTDGTEEECVKQMNHIISQLLDEASSGKGLPRFKHSTVDQQLFCISWNVLSEQVIKCRKYSHTVPSMRPDVFIVQSVYVQQAQILHHMVTLDEE